MSAVHVAIPGDVVQIVIEYLPNGAMISCCRSVSSKWQKAVADAVGFLNQKNWTALDSRRRAYYGNRVSAMKLGAVALAASLSTLDITRLTISDNDVARIGQFCPALTSVTITRCEFVSNPIMKGFRTLLQLNMSMNRGLSSLIGIEHAVELHSLSLAECTTLRDESLRSIGRLPALTSLDLMGCRDLRDVSGLSVAPSLTALFLDRTDVSTEGVAALSACPVLRVLRLKDCSKVADLRPLAKTRSLQVLVAAGTRLEERGFERLQHAPLLHTLSLAGTWTKRVRRLASSTSLASLDLTQTWLRDSDIGGLASMPQLRELVLCGCPGVTDVRGLIASTSLVTLMLQGSPVTNAGISGLERMTQLKTLGLTRTKVDDVSFLFQRPEPLQIIAGAHVRLADGQRPFVTHDV
jgi:hypothetical protein